ncbi:MAG: hypothetical protein IKP40_13595 [Clostridia bacterium]|nr:hypothetical protein [Clostridia bacterium]
MELIVFASLSLFLQIIFAKDSDEQFVPELGFKGLLAFSFQPSVQFRIPLVQVHVNVVPEPYHASPAVGSLPPAACVYMVQIKVYAGAGDIAFTVSL